MKFRLINNSDYKWKKRKRKKKPKNMEQSILDKDLTINKGDSFNSANKNSEEYFYNGKPLGVDKPHV